MDSRISKIWNYLGSAWDSFEDKSLVETFWEALASGIQQTYRHVGNTQFSRTVQYMNGSYDDGPEVFFIVYSGQIADVNVSPVAPTSEQVSNGTFEINTSGWSLTGTAARSTAYAYAGSGSLYVPPRSSATYDFGYDLSYQVNASMYVYLLDPEDAGDVNRVHIELLDSNNNVIVTTHPLSVFGSWQKVNLYSTSQKVRKIRFYSYGKYVHAYYDAVSVVNTALFSYALPHYTYSIPTLTYRYKYNGVEYSGTYTQGTDYLITASLDTLIWIGTAPNADLRYPSTEKVIIARAPNVYRVNQVLVDVWLKIIKLDLFKHWPYYTTFGQEKYKHLKYFAWALAWYQMKPPSIHALRNSYAIAHGLPFAYNSGILNYTITSGICRATIGGDTYVFPSGLRPVASGYYDQFEVIASGVDLYDYVNNAGLINSYTNIYTRRNTIIYDVDATTSGCSYSSDYLNTYITRIMPEQISYLQI